MLNKMTIRIHIKFCMLVHTHYEKVMHCTTGFTPCISVATSPKEINEQLKNLNEIIHECLAESDITPVIEYTEAYRRGVFQCFTISHHSFNSIGTRFNDDKSLTIDINMKVTKQEDILFIHSIANRLTYEFSRFTAPLNAIQLFKGAECFLLEKKNNSIEYLRLVS